MSLVDHLDTFVAGCWIVSSEERTRGHLIVVVVHYR